MKSQGACMRFTSGCIIQEMDSATHCVCAIPGHAAHSISGSFP